jgi:hypothetical protein
MVSERMTRDLPGYFFIKSSQLSNFSIVEVVRGATPEVDINLAGRKAELLMASKSSEAAAWENPRETMV